MVTQKIFHLHYPIAEARGHLCDLENWGLSAGELRVICAREGSISRFEFHTPEGRLVVADIEEITGEDPARILFRSVGGDFELAGMVELFGIRDNLTEVVMTLDYEPASPLVRAYMAMDRVVNRLLSRMEETSGVLQPGVC